MRLLDIAMTWAKLIMSDKLILTTGLTTTRGQFGCVARSCRLWLSARNTLLTRGDAVDCLCQQRPEMLARRPGGQGVAGSNPVSPTSESPCQWSLVPPLERLMAYIASSQPMSSAARGSLMAMPSYNLVIALPTADRSRTYAFVRTLGLETPGELAEDSVPEPLRVQLNEQASVMYVPTGGFGWITAGRATAEPGSSECLLSLQVATTTEVDELVGRVEAAGGRVKSGPEQKAWGYSGTFTDPDGHLWEAIVSAI